MEDYRTACKLIPRRGYLATIDLKDAYFLIPIRLADRKYLRFQFQPHNSTKIVTYEFSGMPFGLSVAPRVFTKIMREAIGYLRHRGHKSVFYLDDILCIGDTYQQCYINVKETLNLLKCLGFVINYDKSNLTPRHTCKFLGFNYDAISLNLCLPPDKRSKIMGLIIKFSKLPLCSIREFSQLIGVLISACPAVKYGWMYTKILEQQKYLSLLKYGNYDTKITPSKVILKDLHWWSRNIQTTVNFIRQPNYDIEIYTDASRSGWGAVSNDAKRSGRWKDTEKIHHINYLELMAAFLGLKSFANELRNCAILLRIDNTTAISYINRMGGVQHAHLNNLARSLWQWCEQRNIWIFASYVNTKENKADAASRAVNPDTEWSLSDNAFKDIIRHFGLPKIDLFASRENAKCPKFVSWKQDPDAVAVDAFTLNWNLDYFYAFPPFSLILRCLRKIIDDEANGILVYPYWPSQPWFPLLQNLIVSDVLYLNPNKYLLQSHFRDHHPLHKNLTLGVARLSGGRSFGTALAQNRQH
ncbi:hypothetical protein O3G_MSEX009753 [Manduca sexta]|uniref:Reverse transcriptase domain-containing protein n=1 Tax=Manduca sexta TaxID=7130 RepID=A0A921ZGQ0_MANSE|nr:hypothetical protein O3G_MSEX009753 [Manduca sexta]